jgi:hypothetical protein
MLTHRAKKEKPKEETPQTGPTKKLVTGYVSVELIAKIKAEAKRQRRSQTGMISIILEDWAAQQK